MKCNLVHRQHHHTAAEQCAVDLWRISCHRLKSPTNDQVTKADDFTFHRY